MYVCMYACVYVQYIYVSQGDFRLMSFTAGRCGTPLILNDQLRRNGATKPRSAAERSEAAGVGPKAPAAERSEAAGVGPKGLYEPNRTGRSVLF